MTLTTRIRHKVLPRSDSGDGGIMIVGRYKVEGEKRLLRVEYWASWEIAEDKDLMGWALGQMDEEAEWCAAHPEEIQTAELMWT